MRCDFRGISVSPTIEILPSFMFMDLQRSIGCDAKDGLLQLVME